MIRRELTGIDYSEFEHPLERKAFETLKNAPAFEMLINKLKPYLKDEILKVPSTGSDFKVGPKSVPELYNSMGEICRILNLNFTPELYITNDSSITACTAGIDKPAVILSTGAMELLNGDEIYFILGTQVSRIKSKKLLHHEVLKIISSSNSINISDSIPPSLKISLNIWARMLDYSIDRGGLLVCQDINSAYRVMAKISGLPQKNYNSFNIGQYIAQIKETTAVNFETIDRAAVSVYDMWKGRSFAASRALELNKWVEGRGYESLINRFNGGKTVGAAQKSAGFCTQCGYKLTGTEMFCPGCGKRTR